MSSFFVGFFVMLFFVFCAYIFYKVVRWWFVDVHEPIKNFCIWDNTYYEFNEFGQVVKEKKIK